MNDGAMIASGPPINITVRSGERLVVELEKEGMGRLPVSTELSLANAGPYLRRFYRELGKFLNRLNVGLKISDFNTVSRAMLGLHELGRWMNLALFGERRYRVEEFFQTAWPGWNQLDKEAYGPPLIQVMTRLDPMLPFEFLPLFNTTAPEPIRDKPGLISTAARFPGFSAVVHRIYLRPSESPGEGGLDNQVLENIPRLKLRFFQHAGLTGACRERQFFEQTPWIDLRGPWPEELIDEEEFVSQFADLLWKAAQPGRAGGAEAVDQIQHFACHCDTDRDDSADYSLFLLHPQRWWDWRKPVRQVSIRALGGRFGGFPQRATNQDYPLIFLNACGASKLTAEGVTSFPKLFLGIRNRGVIGTEASIPDHFAAEFSKMFYTNLIQGASLGEALYRARRRLLIDENNPLGILYTIYAPPGLRVRKPLPAPPLPPQT